MRSLLETGIDPVVDVMDALGGRQGQEPVRSRVRTVPVDPSLFDLGELHLSWVLLVVAGTAGLDNRRDADNPW